MNRFTRIFVFSALLPVTAGAQSQPSAASAGFGPEGDLRTVGDIGYVAPKGWSVREAGGGVVMVGPVPQQYQPCLLVIDPSLASPAVIELP
jgi:uncharacterized membrane protein